MKKHLITLLFVCIGSHLATSQEVQQITLGTTHTLYSTILNEDRAYYLHLPDSYHDAASSYKKYPILIILDGNVHFKPITGLVNYMSSDAYRSCKIPEMIVVGIQNIDRRRDYTPDKVVTVRKNTTGGGELFLRFLEDELIPELDKKYRTEPYRMLFGHSLGGLLAAHTYTKKTTLFNAFLAVDPSFGTWDENTMDTKLDAVTQQSFQRFIYIATANWGKRNIRNRDRHIRFYEALHSKSNGTFFAKLEYFKDENHASVPPIAFYHGISSIFKGYGISYRDVESKEQLTQHFKALSKRLSYNFKPPETLVNQIGYRMLRSSNKNEKLKALDFFILNTENYPNSFNAFDSLAETYEYLGDYKKAIKNYKKSLQLNPNNQQANKKIKSLSKHN